VVGVIDAVGKDVPTIWQAGQCVGVGWHAWQCGYCDFCRRGDFFACVHRSATSMAFPLRPVKIIWMKKSPSPVRKGRPPRQNAESHAAIVDAVFALLQEKSVRDLTMEEVAKRAKVGKPTLYK
jgi:Alcohol dehydrogenase GroES-like domain/Bacterial regulatory proteins, tetR family